MSDREPGLQEVLVAAFQSQMQDVYTAIPCIVVAVRNNGETAEVDIQPTIGQKFKNGKRKARSVILGVPVSFPVSSNAGVLFPIKVGTTGTAIFSMRSLETWKGGTGELHYPSDRGKYDASDAIFYPGIQPGAVSLANPAKHAWQHSPDDVVVFNNIGTGNENEFRLQPSGNVLVNTNQDVLINCNNATLTAQGNIDMSCKNFSVDAQENVSISAATGTVSIGITSWTGTYNFTGTHTAVGSLTFNGIDFTSHRHPETGTITNGPIN